MSNLCGISFQSKLVFAILILPKSILPWEFPPDSGNSGSPCGPRSLTGLATASCRNRCAVGTEATSGSSDCKAPLVCCLDRSSRITDHLYQEPGCGIRPLRVQFPQGRNKHPSLQWAVVGGKEAVPFSWPWMAAIYLKTPVVLPNVGGRFHCGAVLIGRRHLLTAGHCFASRLKQLVAEDFYVLLGSHERSVGVRASLDRIWVHPKYIPRLNYYDIAILRLEVDAPNRATIKPICLPPPFRNDTEEELSLAGRTAVLTGWGDIEFGGPRSTTLMEVSMPIVTNQECDGAYRKVASRAYPQGITQDLMCAGAMDGGIDACQGDSGGPLVTSEGGSWMLRGLVSFGYGCGQPGYPGVYTRVDAYLQWISEQVQSGGAPL